MADTDVTVEKLYGIVRAVPTAQRRRSEWVMSQATFDRLALLPEAQEIAAQHGRLDRMFDMPIRIDAAAQGIELLAAREVIARG